MKKLFISQPMKDKTDEEILAERQKAIEKAESMASSKTSVNWEDSWNAVDASAE